MDTEPIIRVVIADDEPSIRDGLHAAIPWKKLNMEVIGTARDGEDVWNLIKISKPDIAITDIRMPRLTGLELIRRCREQQVATEFIILSGYDDFIYAQTAIRYGARAYLLKPLDISQLAEELERLAGDIRRRGQAYASLPPETYQALQASSKKLFLNQLIQNEFRHGSDIRQKIVELHLPLTDAPYRILVFSIRYQAGEAPLDTARQIKNTIAKMTVSSRACVWESNPEQVLLILHQDPNESCTPGEFARACLKNLSRFQNYQLTVGIGSEEAELKYAGRSYACAMTCLAYRLYESSMAVYDESVLCTQPPHRSPSGIDSGELTSAIRRHDTDGIRNWCRDYFQSLLYVPMPPPEYIRGMVIYLITDVQRALGRQTADCQELFNGLPTTELYRLFSYRDIETWTADLFLQYADAFRQYVQGQKDMIILDAKQYIQSHIHKKIQAEDVAAHVNLSTSYFTIYFKSKTGINFRNYVLDRKMEHAKHLLETGLSHINEVSYAVGYDDSRSFYRAFKNHTGMTPSEYQASCRPQEIRSTL